MLALPETAVQVINTTDRAAVGELITMTDYVDVIVPRGGKGLIERISADARVPVIKHLDGNCHVYIDDRADLKKGTGDCRQCQDSSLWRLQCYGVTADCRVCCDQNFCLSWQRSMLRKMLSCAAADKSRDILETIIEATEEDWGEEYLAPILSIKIVARYWMKPLTHINKYSSQHTEVDCY